MKNSTIILITFILMSIVYSIVGSIEKANLLYAASIIFVAGYGILKKEINITHIALIFFTIYSFEYFIIEIFTEKLKEIGMSKIFIANIHFGFQITSSLIATVILIFRVQLSRLITKSEEVSLTLFDGITPWIYIYMTLISTLTAVEYNLDYFFDFKYFSFVYDYYEVFIHISMSAVISTLLSMLICHEKDLKKQTKNIE
ncbi:hypothetical protein [Pseudoalteromonas aurantia]|uniref:Uncharacterized protein n=1 Tax=Pseudoalteromonas aurantia TaxID=43654 RepID=A0ABY2VZE5_9GAMM|nr:hypothetical protein [Pseudoalteromonas aurantia]TMO75808.1 hypothetical protein CWC20_07555 [Pseudoalteromonas aurantia]